MATTETIDGEVVDDQAVGENPDQEEAVLFDFGNKAVVDLTTEQSLVRERIQKHEEQLVHDEMDLFEAKLLGKDTAALEEQIRLRYALVQRYVVAFNTRYGGSENA